MRNATASILLVVWWLPASPVSGFQSPRESACTDWRECRELALAASERKEFETFHDLAWRAVQTGPRNDPALMYLLARAQALSGRPHDALVMIDRLAGMGVAPEVAGDEFTRTRELPGWPAVALTIDAISASAVAAATNLPPVTAPSARVEPDPPTRSAAPSAVKVAPPALLAVPALVSEAARFSTNAFDVAGLAYDSVSDRLVLGDRLGRKLMIVGAGAGHAVDLVRAESAGFEDISAIAIDSRRGDLWVTSAPRTGGGGMLHRVQLVSGRPLRTYAVAADVDPVALVDLAVGTTGTVLVLDAANGQLLTPSSSDTTLERLVRIDAAGLTSVTAGPDETSAYVSHRDGVSRVDLRARTVRRVAVPKDVSLEGVGNLRWYRNSLVAVRSNDDGSRAIVRFELNGSGTTITRVSALDASLPDGGRPFLAVSGNELLFVASPDRAAGTPPAADPAEFVAYRIRLR